MLYETLLTICLNQFSRVKITFSENYGIHQDPFTISIWHSTKKVKVIIYLFYISYALQLSSQLKRKDNFFNIVFDYQIIDFLINYPRIVDCDKTSIGDWKSGAIYILES